MIDDPNWVLVGVTVWSGVASAVGCWAWWSLGRRFAPKDGVPDDLGDQLSALHTRQNQQATDMAVVKAEMDHLPSKEAVHDLNVTLTEVRTTLQAMDRHLQGTSKWLDRVDDRLGRMEERLPGMTHPVTVRGMSHDG